MTSDASNIANVLERILEEIQGFRSDFMEFTGHNTTSMSDLAFAITGDAGYSIGDMMGPLGHNLGDLHTKLEEINSTLSLIDVGTLGNLQMTLEEIASTLSLIDINTIT